MDIYNSTIKAIVGIAANASGTSSNNIKVTIDSSTIDSSERGAEIAVWINVPGNLYINNSIIKGNLQALMVRAGTAVIKDSQIILTNNGNASESTYITDNPSSPWGSGNNVPHGSLIVGNWSNAYKNTASCTLENTQVMTTINNWNRALIVLAQVSGIETIFNYDSNCNLNNSSYVFSNYEVSGLKKGQITVNGTVVQAIEN